MENKKVAYIKYDQRDGRCIAFGDNENEVFTEVYNHLDAEFQDAYCTQNNLSEDEFWDLFDDDGDFALEEARCKHFISFLKEKGATHITDPETDDVESTLEEWMQNFYTEWQS